MTWRAFLVALVAFTVLSRSAAAQSDAEIKRAMGEVAGELQQCSVYFLVISTCVAGQEPTLARTYQDSSDKVGVLAISSSRAAGVSDEAYVALGKLEADEMMKSMGELCQRRRAIEKVHELLSAAEPKRRPSTKGMARVRPCFKADMRRTMMADCCSDCHALRC